MLRADSKEQDVVVTNDVPLIDLLMGKGGADAADPDAAADGSVDGMAAGPADGDPLLAYPELHTLGAPLSPAQKKAIAFDPDADAPANDGTGRRGAGSVTALGGTTTSSAGAVDAASPSTDGTATLSPSTETTSAAQTTSTSASTGSTTSSLPPSTSFLVTTPSIAAAPAQTAAPAKTTQPSGGTSEAIAAPAAVAAAAAAPNKIVLENQKTGNPVSEWGVHGQMDGPGDANIQGFATDISVNVGSTVDFKIATDSTHYRIDIYRMGYYGGDGARLVGSIDNQLATAQVQPHPIVDYSIGLIDCGNWSVSASWQVPADATSGIYFAKLTREDGTSGENMIPFIVRDDASKSDIVFQTSDTTWEAYNAWGGASLYTGNVPTDPNDMIGWLPPNCSCGLQAIGRASAVSYNRPFITSVSPIGGPWDFIFGAEYPAIRFLEQNGYDVSYMSGVDSARSGQTILNHEAFLSVGHDEYWSAEQRAAVEAARNAGVNLAFWSGNEVYWKVRWETSIDGSGTPYRTMVCYKQTLSNADLDPSVINTGTWRDPRFQDPGQTPENALTGTLFTVDSYRSDQITIPYDQTQLRIWRNTAVAGTAAGQTATLAGDYLGYEWDSDVDNGYRPAGLINLSSTTLQVDTKLLDYGNTVGSGTATHSLTMYRDAASGALVFSAGTVYWSWALDDNHTAEANPTNPSVQQAMINLFADMGIQPQTLMASLSLATQSTDVTAPTSTITSPIGGTTVVEGQTVTITGTAADTGGGVVAGVEVSTDGGATWHKASGTKTWSYSWTVQKTGPLQILSRAADDSLNLEKPSAGLTVSTTPAGATLFSINTKPATAVQYLERDPLELGVKFSSSQSGAITGIRFWKDAINTGPHQVDLWSADGRLLASASSTNESYSGWQTVTFAQPVTIAAGTTYVASYSTNGLYVSAGQFFASAYTSGPLTVQAGGSVFANGGAGSFPTQTWNNENYWVDPIFNTGTTTQVPPVAADDTVSGTGASIAIAASTLLANDADANFDTLSITGVSNAVNGTVALSADGSSVTFTPSSGFIGTASFNYAISDGHGGVSSAKVVVNVQAAQTSFTIFGPNEAPTSSPDSDASQVELGVKFTASSAGTVTAIRYYKSAQDTGTHTGSLWAADGTLLATGTFQNETASGWQTLVLTQPVSISAGTTYVAGYQSNGHYIASANYFSSSKTNGPLTAPSSALAAGNGVFGYGANNPFPTQSYNATNYWVDVAFSPSSGGSANIAPVAQADSVSTSAGTSLAIAAATLLANDSDADGGTLAITGVTSGTGGSAVWDATNKIVTFMPAAGFSGTASFTYSLSDGQGGTATGTVSVGVSAASQSLSLFGAGDTPPATSANDPSQVELGLKFVASSAGAITGVRFYKGAGDAGTHTGSLWTSGGQLLATGTFQNETASGWQTLVFSQPVSIAAGTTYVASYHSNGNYVASSSYFTTVKTSGPLSAPATGNGVFAYGSSSLFPNQSYNASNYWVDVLYTQSGGNTVPIAAADGPYATTQGTALTLGASALLANDSDADGDTLSITGVTSGTGGTAAWDSVAQAVTFTPTAGFSGTADFSYAISDGKGGSASAKVSVSVGGASDQSLLSAGATPASPNVADATVQLGLKFSADVAGSITAIKFYKAASETGSHTGTLWSATGSVLGTVTFQNETASGWQTGILSTPVAIDANTTYVVSYNANDHYAATGKFFDAPLDNGNLHAAAGGSGVYAYGSTASFPTASWNNTNYYVDVAFKPQLAA